MSVLLSVRDLAHSFGAQPLFQGVSFTLSEGDRVGLIGPNGAGKSTLLRILSGTIAPDRGDVVRRGGLRTAILDQVPSFTSKLVRDAVAEGHRHQGESWEVEQHIDEWISKLDLDPAAEIESLSGGWQKRVALARALVAEPELLLLDEPTNHLDVDSIIWLEKLLGSAPFATLTITHDRLFLQRVANRILELDKRNLDGLLDVKGDYQKYLEVKSELMEAQKQREQSLRNTLRRETEWLRQGAKARSTKQEARIQRAEALGKEVSAVSSRNRTRDAGVDFVMDEGPRSKRLIEAQGVEKSFGDKVVLAGIDVLITPKTRLGLLGPNGCGKSTLLRILTGEEEPSAGSVFRSDNLKVAYFEQDRSSLRPDVSLGQAISPDGDHVLFRGASMHRNGYLERFLFRSEQMVQPVSSLSGGEQSRLLIARLMLQPANLLILDEPTNDLDLPTLTVLEEALASFEGAVILVTHDRYFLDQVTDEVLAFHTSPGEAGKVTRLFGLSQWEDWMASQQRARKGKPRASEEPPKDAKRGGKKKLGFKEQREWDTLEARILEAEERLGALETECESPEAHKDGTRLATLTQEMESTRASIAAMYERWAELEALRAE